MVVSPPSPDVQSDFGRHPFPRLLFYLFKKRFLGKVSLQLPNGPCAVYFRDGLPVRCDLSSTEDVLGRVLLEHGWIDQQAFHRSLEELAKGDGRLQGRILCEMGTLSDAHLIQGLRIQLRRKLNRLFPVEHATFALFNGDHEHGVEAEARMVRADPLAVIYHGIRNAYDAPRLTRELVSLDGMQLSLRPQFDKFRTRFALANEDTGLVMMLMRGALPIGRVFAISDIGPVATQMLIYALWVTEMLVVEPAAEQAAAGPPPSRLAAPAPAPPSAPPATSDAVVELADAPKTAPDVGTLAEQYGNTGERPAQVRMGSASRPHGEEVEVVIPAAAEAPAFAPISADTPLAPGATDPGPPAALSPTDMGAIDATAVGDGPILIAPDDQPILIPPMGQPAPGTSSPAGEPPEPTAVLTLADTPDASAPDADAADKLRRDRRALNETRAVIDQAFSRLQDQNHFEVLDVPRDAKTEQIREAYFELAKRFHPDRVRPLGVDELTDKAEEVFRKLNEAHTTLTDEERRHEYEAELDGGGDSSVRAALQAEVAFQKGLVLFRKKRFRDAREQFKESVRLAPSEGEHLAWVARCVFSDPRTDREKMLPKLKQQLLEAVNISPRSPACHYFLGEVYLALDDTKRAMTCFNRTIEINPNHVDAERHLRIIRMRRDRDKQRDQKGKGLLNRLLKK